MPKSYSDKLRDPRWQKKRLEILERANWKCEDCGTSTEQLHVHHCFYVKGREPWEYGSNSLIAVCDPCHKERAEAEALAQRWLAVMLRFSDKDTIESFTSLFSKIAMRSPGFVGYDPESQKEGGGDHFENNKSSHPKG